MKVMIGYAIDLAKTNTSKFKFGAVARRADGAIVRSRNNRAFFIDTSSGQSARALPDSKRNSSGHAETRLAYRAGAGSTMWVVRLTANGELANAKPCPRCENILRFHKVKMVYYSCDDGTIRKMKLNV